jgi:hypothetical protein
MKLSQTQQRLISAARLRGGTTTVEGFLGRGSGGGRISGGWREFNAAQGLVRLGLAERIAYDRSMQMMGNGYNVWNSILRIKLTSAAPEPTIGANDLCAKCSKPFSLHDNGRCVS